MQLGGRLKGCGLTDGRDCQAAISRELQEVAHKALRTYQWAKRMGVRP